MNNTPTIRKQVIIDLSEYGGHGTLVLEALTPTRRNALYNNIGMCNVTNERTGESYKRYGDMAIYNYLAFIVTAPFMSSPAGATISNWLGFMERFTDGGLGLCKRLNDEIQAFMESEGDTPLAPSGGTGPKKRSGKDT